MAKILLTQENRQNEKLRLTLYAYKQHRSLEDLAQACHVSRATMTRWMHYPEKMRIADLRMVGYELGVPAEELIRSLYETK